VRVLKDRIPEARTKGVVVQLPDVLLEESDEPKFWLQLDVLLSNFCASKTVLDWMLAEAELDELFVTAGEPNTDEPNGDELKF